jgi:chitin disaccharide deacetylase
MLRALSALSVVAVAILSVVSSIAQQPSPSSTTNLAERLGHPANARLLIIHADDFAMMHVDTAIEEAFENQWVTSASILVPCPWFPEVAQWAKTGPTPTSASISL